jgi:cell division protein FtsZ
MPNKFEHVYILGVGGGGGKILQEMAARRPGDWVKLVYLDSDLRDLEFVSGVLRVPLGQDWSQGVGCGGDALLGENLMGGGLKELRDLLAPAELVILVGCLGGGTASGGLQVLNRLVREEQRTSLCFVTLPLAVEGSERSDVARRALEGLREREDVVVAVENDLILHQLPPQTPVVEALAGINGLIANGVLGLAAMVRCREGIPVNYASLRTLLRERPAACAFGTGRGVGDGRAHAAIEELFQAPLLGGAFLRQAHIVLGALSGGPDLTVSEMDECLNELHRRLNPLTRTLIGAACLPEQADGGVQLTVLAIQYEQQGDQIDRTSLIPIRRQETLKLVHAGTTLPAVSGVLGIFGNASPTMRNGENLDIPTFLRRGLPLERVTEASDDEPG